MKKENRTTQEFAREIYAVLEKRKEYCSIATLASLLNTDPRSLRAHGEEEGTLDAASRWILKRHGKVMVVRMSKPAGVKLTDDPEEIEKAMKQWSRFHWRIQKRVKMYEAAMKVLTKQPKQRYEQTAMGFFSHGDGV